MQDRNRPVTYEGHLPNGNPVQAHSANRLYAEHGVTLRYIESADGTRCMWEACKNGKVIAANPSHSGCEILAWAAVAGA
jgi:hypothetical protein